MLQPDLNLYEPAAAAPDRPNAMQPRSFRFGAFTYLPDQALLLRAGEPVRLGSRALDILGCLLDEAGRVVDKQALFRRVWPTTVVEEVSLRVHLAALRKALGDGENGARYIINTPGRGYRFVAPVQSDGRAARQTAPVEPTSAPGWTSLGASVWGYKWSYGS
jgi:DNA-binding winged helix-turn-helix (wHTH) protein